MERIKKFEQVPSVVVQLEKNKDDYIPQAVSLGLFHHGYPKLNLLELEVFKPIAVELFISGGPYNKSFYHNKIAGIIGEIRNCYGDLYRYGDLYCSDDCLAEIMLRDASLMIIYMETSTVTEHPDELMMKKINAMMDHLGILTLAFMAHDMVLLDNQIPLVVVKVLMDLRYGEGREGEGQYEKLLNRFINMVIFGEYRQQIVLSRKPMHLLEAIHMVVVFGGEDESGAAPTPTCCKLLCCPRADLESGATTHGIIHRLLKSLACKTQGAAKNDYNSFINSIHSFRSVTELKAKGIHFRPGPTSLMDVSFKSNFFYSTLHLREWILTPNTKVLFKNLVAYELSPGSPANREVTSYYITFMKSLIDRPEDVKELREKKIFINKLGSDQEVFNIYKDINTHGADNPMIFHAVKDKIQEHYNSNIKTWMAELIHNYFRSPWTMTAFLAAAALLAISFYHLVNFN